MKRIIVTLLLFSSLLASIPRLAFADLGDTMEIARLKYGLASATNTPNILSYVHGRFRIWQSYVDNLAVIAEFSPLDHTPLTPAECRELDAANLPGGLVPGKGPGWKRVEWPGTISYQFAGATLFQVMESRGSQGYSRMYLNSQGILFLKSLPR